MHQKTSNREMIAQSLVCWNLQITVLEEDILFETREPQTRSDLKMLQAPVSLDVDAPRKRKTSKT